MRRPRSGSRRSSAPTPASTRASNGSASGTRGISRGAISPTPIRVVCARSSRGPGAARDPKTAVEAGVGLTDSVPLDRWTFERFGLTPSKLARRATDRSAPRVFCVSIPKAGTHLLERALCLHPRMYRKLLPTVSDENIGKVGGFGKLLHRIRAGEVVASHLRFAPPYPQQLERSGVAGVFLVRDPHDIVVSQVHYVSKRANHRLHDAFAERDAREKLRLAITGDHDRGAPS